MAVADSTEAAAAAANPTQAASSIKPSAAPGLGAYARLMPQLGDPSASREQPTPQKSVPPAKTDMPMQQFQAALPYFPQPKPQSHGVGESSVGAADSAISSINFRSYASHFGAHGPRFNAPAALPPPQAPVPSASAMAAAEDTKTVASAEYSAADTSAHLESMLLRDTSAPQTQQQTFVPTTTAANLLQQLQALQIYCAGESSAYVPPNASGSSSTSSAFYGSRFNAPAAVATLAVPTLGASADPVAPCHPPVWQPSSMLSTSASRIPSNSGLNPHASAFQNTLPSTNPVDHQPLFHTTVLHPYSYLSLEQVRSRLRSSPMEADLLMFPETTGHVVRLLGEGNEQVRRSVLVTVMRDLRVVMGSDQRRAVLIALVRACAGRRDELKQIFKAMSCTAGFVVCVGKHSDGLTILQELISAVSPHPELLARLIWWLLSQRLMEQSNGVELLHYCFTRMPYDHIKFIIRFAIVHIGELLFSAYGSKSLAECFVYARNDELRAFEVLILNHTNMIATGQYSNYFLQQAIESGSETFQVAITQRVAAGLLELCSSQFGSFVVEACFLNARTLAPLQIMLSAFLALPAGELAEMVQGSFSNFVVSKLLGAAKKHFPQEARSLAQQIGSLPPAVQGEVHARGVMAVVKKMDKHPSTMY